jgi:isocitrate dehydrogenase kinase/phosphatase
MVLAKTRAVRFNLTPVEEKSSRQYRKGSKYDPILDAFMEEEDLVEVNVSGRDANYLRTQLNKRIDARNLKKVKVSVVNNVCYLEKL